MSARRTWARVRTVTAGRANHTPEAPRSAPPKPPGKLTETAEGPPHACASLRWGGCSSWGTHRRCGEALLTPTRMSAGASTSCDPGQATPPALMGEPQPRDGTTYLEYDEEDKGRGYPTGSLVGGRPQGPCGGLSSRAELASSQAHLPTLEPQEIRECPGKIHFARQVGTRLAMSVLTARDRASALNEKEKILNHVLS